jgi:hypothetical protein
MGIVLQQAISVFYVRLDVKQLVRRLSKVKIFPTKAVLFDKAPAALLMENGGFK